MQAEDAHKTTTGGRRRSSWRHALAIGVGIAVVVATFACLL